MIAPKFFPTSEAWREWLEKYHERESELLVGFHKRQSGLPSITWPESVDGALCFGWIDGVRRRLNDTSYTIRFTPRKPRSIWSAVNIRRAKELTALGLMHPAGLAAFEARTEDRSRVYSFEQSLVAFESHQVQRFEANVAAWAFFEQQAPSYRKMMTWWVISGKQAATREKRLTALIENSAKGIRMR